MMILMITSLLMLLTTVFVLCNSSFCDDGITSGCTHRTVSNKHDEDKHDDDDDKQLCRASLIICKNID